ncbi:hypothetical protein [Halorhabdus rudnickae]|nr:hypothetical protein [Halorhabdus rudnickae]
MSPPPILPLNFGEPALPEREAVVSYLKRIYRMVEGDTTVD